MRLPHDRASHDTGSSSGELRCTQHGGLRLLDPRREAQYCALLATHARARIRMHACMHACRTQDTHEDARGRMSTHDAYEHARNENVGAGA